MIPVQQAVDIAKRYGIPPSIFLAFIEVETGGKGFDDKTGKIIIQFEPSWFRKKAPYAPSGRWSLNGVERQAKEWEAFNNAFRINPDAAMESTSIGLPQILGLHWKLLGYKSVGEMWDHFKKGEREQVEGLALFIRANKGLLNAITSKDYHMMAYIYNGPKYREYAKKWGREPYNISLQKADAKYLKIL